jgi:glycosyltransferase involved in cell wall biosynthesis
MKIAMLLPGGVDRSGIDGVIHARLWLIERLAQRHEVHVFALAQHETPGEWTLLGAQVHDVGRDEGKLRRLRRSFAQRHRARHFDVVHAFFGWSGTYAALLGWRHRLPVLFHPSGGEFVALPECGYGMRCTAAGRLGARVAIAGARRVTVATPYMQRLAEARGVRAELVPLGVALDRWPAGRPCPRHGAARLLHVGDLRPVKDQAMLLAAAGHLLDAGLDFTLDVVGRDTMGGELQRSDAARRLGTRLRWHGVLRREPLRALMDESHLLLVTSRHEAGPLVVLEGAIAGVPTVGTAVGHVAEWTPDAAVAVPVGDAGALARETIALLGDEPRRLALADAAARRAVAIDADYTARTFETMYAAMAR